MWATDGCAAPDAHESAGELWVRGVLRGNFGIGNQFGDYAVWTLIALLTRRRLVVTFGNTLPLEQFFQRADGTPWNSSVDHGHREVLESDGPRPCSDVTDGVLGHGSVSVTLRAANSFILAPKCVEGAGNVIVWPDAGTTRRVFALVGETWNGRTALWRQVIDEPDSRMASRMRCAMHVQFHPRPELEQSLARWAPPAFDVLHIRTGVTEEGDAAFVRSRHLAVAPTTGAEGAMDAAYRTLWHRLNQGCTVPSRALHRAVTRLLADEATRPLVVLSDAPVVCPAARAVFGDRIRCVQEFYGVMHSVYAHSEGGGNLQTATELLALTRGARVWRLAPSTFSYWAHVRARAVRVQPALPEFTSNKVLPICRRCEDASVYFSRAQALSCHESRVRLLARPPTNA